MTVKKLSKKTEEEKSTENQDELIEQFINGGGKTTEESRNNQESPEDLSRFTIRMPNGLVKMIDDHRKGKVGNISRNTWILEAIAKRLKQDD